VNLRILAAVVMTSLITGCASVGQSNVLATPWGAAGLHTFAKATPVVQQESPYTEERISRLLTEQSAEQGTLVAARDP
jgi:hypothetical protein